jgi:hypothetical protein
VAEEEHRLVPFEPALPPHTNGNGHRRRRRLRIGTGVVFGALLGSLVATNYIGRVHWLNLSVFTWWGRFALAAAVAGVMAGTFRRDDVRAAALAGGVAGIVSIWSVYAIVRVSVHPIFVDRSLARVVFFDLLRLFAYAGPPGALGGAVPWMAGRGVARWRLRRART